MYILERDLFVTFLIHALIPALKLILLQPVGCEYWGYCHR